MRIFKIVFLFLTLAIAACNNDSGQSAKPQIKKQQNSDSYVLAFSWQPAFCETAPRKRECRSLSADRYDASHFSLHGLWPQPGSNIYCDISQKNIAMDKSGRWRQMDTPRIAEPIWQELRRIMPGTQSALHKHEWIKHGVCYNGNKNIDTYYQHSLMLMATLNASNLRQFFASHIGQQVTGKEIYTAFDQDFGKDASKRLRLSCKRDRNSNRQLIVEMTLGLGDALPDILAKLSGKKLDQQTLAKLILAAPETDPGCPAGIIDPAEFQ